MARRPSLQNTSKMLHNLALSASPFVWLPTDPTFPISNSHKTWRQRKSANKSHGGQQAGTGGGPMIYPFQGSRLCIQYVHVNPKSQTLKGLLDMPAAV